MSNYPRSRPRRLDDDDLDAQSVLSAHESFMDLTSPISPPHHTREFYTRTEEYHKSKRGASRSRAGSPTSSVSTTGSITFAPIKPVSSADRQPSIRIDTDSYSTLSGAKPPLPTSPKPDFMRSASADSKGKGRRSHSRTRSPKTPVGRDFVLRVPEEQVAVNVPPTTNFLDPHERADLVRKTRKLAQVFGQTPSPLAVCPPGQLTVAVTGKQQHRRAAASVSGDSVPPPSAWGSALSLSAASSPSTARRFSTPLSPSDLISLAHAADGGDDAASFIDLSEEENDDGPTQSPEVRGAAVESEPRALDSAGDSSSMANDDSAEEDRRRKREKLAKLHRFLGSRVPAALVLGLPDPDSSLPPAAPSSAVEPFPTSAGSIDDTSPRSWRIRRRRSSSAAEMKSRWLDHIDRVKDDLDEREKAINVRRAVKMEKVFGVQPPQTLYHTRPPPPQLLPIGRSPSMSPPALSPMTFRRMSPTVADRPLSSPVLSTSPTSRNINQSAYINKRAHYISGRHSPTESTHHLLDPNDDDQFHAHHHSSSTSDIGSFPGDRSSSVYMHFRHSLNSLNDILDRDDKESLAELHRYLTGGQPENPFEPAPVNEALLEHDPDAQSLRAERRRSLPARASVLSLASQFTLASPEPEMVSFQARRRRAAKLTNFFGVDYRDLVGDVLESIESGVEEERHRGSLQPEEVQDLLQKLRRIKTKRTGL
ncbi:hypothetical protein DENSPDRAFT_113350 [Dentipellis sp. KUC8613]|nr:hypothetical protein DENSPDRAFT_113350 [Dentipellis sp. KUC8613]